MDYTDYDRFMAEIVSSSTTLNPSPDKSLVDELITAASRAVDHYCTGVTDPDADNYFASATITLEQANGQVDNHGRLLLFPRKPIITAVTALNYRFRIRDPWTSVQLSEIQPDGPKVEAWPTGITRLSTKAFCQISYTGGYGTTVATLPADFVELVTMLAIRFYREAETGLTDAIGVAELSTLVYTKAWPIRVTDGLRVFKRRTGWRYTV